MAVNFFDNCTVWPRTFKFIRKKFDNCTVWLFDNCTVRLFDNCTVVFFDNFPVPRKKWGVVVFSVGLPRGFCL